MDIGESFFGIDYKPGHGLDGYFKDIYVYACQNGYTKSFEEWMLESEEMERIRAKKKKCTDKNDIIETYQTNKMEAIKHLTHKEDNLWTWEIYLYPQKKEGTYATQCRGIIKSMISYNTEEEAGAEMNQMIEDLGLEEA